MQNWKIKRMSGKELKAQSKAVGSLLHYYQKGSDYPDDCPLCTIATQYNEKDMGGCSQCLWRIIEKDQCCDFADREFGEDVTDMTRKKEWHKIRIPMLRRWKKILKVELNRRKDG